MVESFNTATKNLADNLSGEEEEEDSHLIKTPSTFSEYLWNINGTLIDAMVIFCDELLDELEYEKLSVDWTMVIERHPCIATEFCKMLSIEAASSNQMEVDFVKKMCTAIQQNMDELWQENTSNVEGDTTEETPKPPKDKDEF